MRNSGRRPPRNRIGLRPQRSLPSSNALGRNRDAATKSAPDIILLNDRLNDSSSPTRVAFLVRHGARMSQHKATCQCGRTWLVSHLNSTRKQRCRKCGARAVVEGRKDPIHWSRNMSRSGTGWGRGPLGLIWHAVSELTGHEGSKKRKLGNQFGMLAILCGIGVPVAYCLILLVLGELTWQTGVGSACFAVFVAWHFSSNDYIR